MNFTTFTIRPDTIFGVTFIVIAPESPLLLQITKADHLENVKKYIEQSKNKGEQERQIGKDKTGVFTGSYAQHPITKTIDCLIYPVEETFSSLFFVLLYKKLLSQTRMTNVNKSHQKSMTNAPIS